MLSLGYPDLLIRPSFLTKYLPGAPHGIEIRADSDAVARNHNFPNEGIYKAEAFFRALGADLEISDFVALGHGEEVIDLNRPVRWRRRNRYDLIIDPGTIEHCFNVAQAMANIASMLKLGGYVYHQDAILFCNHGFYSISPTFFVDFYAANGFAVGQPYQWGKGASLDHDGLVSPIFPIDHKTERTDLGSGMIIGMYVARKDKRAKTRWPIQYKYGNISSRRLSFQPFIQKCLDSVFVFEAECG